MINGELRQQKVDFSSIFALEFGKLSDIYEEYRYTGALV